MGKYQVVLNLYCYVNRGKSSHWRKMALLASVNALSQKIAHVKGEKLCDQFEYLCAERTDRAVMYSVYGGADG